MSSGRKSTHDVVGNVRRFFWLPRGTPRRRALTRGLRRLGVFLLGMGAVAAAIGWDMGTIAMTVGAVWSMIDEVIAGVRHRWPAFLAGLAVGWGVNRLMYAVLPAAHSSWVQYCVHASTTVALLATFVGVSHLPVRRALRPSGA